MSGVNSRTIADPEGKEITSIPDVEDARVQRLHVEAAIRPGSTIGIGIGTADPTLIFRQKMMNGGGSSNMRVNGLVTPVVFQVLADPSVDILLSELRFVFSATAIVFDGAQFGQSFGTLPNGILAEILVNNGQPATLSNIQVNEHFLEFATVTGINVHTEFSGTNDVLVASYSLAGSMKLKANTTDKVKITIRDNITAVQFKYLQATVYGQRVNP